MDLNIVISTKNIFILLVRRLRLLTDEIDYEKSADQQLERFVEEQEHIQKIYPDTRIVQEIQCNLSKAIWLNKNKFIAPQRA